VTSTAGPRDRGRRFHLPSFGGSSRVLLLVLLAVFFGLPLIWLAIAPSKVQNEFVTLPALAFGEVGNYVRAWDHLIGFNDGQILLWAWNSVWYTAAAMIIGLVISIPAGYALATADFRGRRLILWLTLIALIVPASALVLPLFLELSLVGMVGSPWSVILPTAFFPFGVYLAYVFYATSIPKDLLAAGRVDGCSEWQLFRFVCLPISKTLIGLLTFLSFTANWNNYFLPFVMLNDDETYTLAVGLQSLVTGTSMVSMSALRGTSSQLKSPEGALLGLLMVLPLTLVFIVSQRYVIRGALTGSVKG
jgi:multiple sugar transport system permease protein